MAAPMNEPPPAGPVILNLDGQTISHSYKEYTTSFIASSTTTDFSFAFREDPAYLSLDDVSVSTGGGSNIVINGGFEAGTVGSHTPLGWTYLNVYNSSAAGLVEANNPHSGSNNYYDGSVQAYDAITQQLTTIVGNTYDVSFWLDDNSSLSTFSQLSTNGNTTGSGGNGADLLVYAGNGVPVPGTVPLPASAPMFGAALVVLGAVGYGVKRKASAAV